MRSISYVQNGSAREVLQLTDVETPIPGPGEVRVRVAFSGVNPADVKSRMGTTRKIAFPLVIPHSDGAGVIDLVGVGVPESRVGERVWVWNAQWKRPFGTCAEYVVLPAAQAVPLPESVSFAAGACLGIPAMTACHAVIAAGISPGSKVLVTGGAGGVGHYAIQFAKAAGATVLTTISSEAKAKIASDAGVDHVINYKTEDVAAYVQAIVPGGVDVVIDMDFAANAKLLPAIARPRATVIAYGTGKLEAPIPIQQLQLHQLTVRWVFVYELLETERQLAIKQISRALEAGSLRHNIALTLPLEQTAEAHEAVEQGRAAGNVVVEVSQS